LPREYLQIPDIAQKTPRTNSPLDLYEDMYPMEEKNYEQQSNDSMCVNYYSSPSEDQGKLMEDQFLNGPRRNVVGTSLQQNDFNKQIHKDKAYETIDNTYEDLSIEMPKTQTL